MFSFRILKANNNSMTGNGNGNILVTGNKQTKLTSPLQGILELPALVMFRNGGMVVIYGDNVQVSFLSKWVREVIKKKNGKKAVRLTAWVGPPPSPPPKRSGKCEIFWLLFLTLYSDYIRIETNFTPKKYFLTTDPPLLPHPPTQKPSRDIPWYPRF